MAKEAMILAAGLGTRLRPLTNERPKPLVEVVGTPLVCFALEHARRAGATRVALNTHHLHPQLPLALGESYQGMALVWSHEPAILGTGGGARLMRERLGGLCGAALLLNADTLIDVDAAAMARLHDARAPLATLALKDAPDKAEYGVIGTDDEERVLDFTGRTKLAGAAGGVVARERMFCGVHVLTDDVLDVLPPGFSGINVDAYPRLIDEGGTVLGFDVGGYFCDVGTPARLFEANLELLSGSARLEHLAPFARFPASDERRFVSPSAQVDESARLIPPVLVDDLAVVERGAVVGPLAVVGKGCHVGARAEVRRAVLQSSARVSAGERVVGAVLGSTCRMAIDSAVAA